MNQSTRHFGAAVVLFLGAFVFGLAISGGAQSTPGMRGLQASRTRQRAHLEQQLQNIPRRRPSGKQSAPSDQRTAHGRHRSRAIASRNGCAISTAASDSTREIVTYNAWLPLPREVKLELTAPERKTLGIAGAALRRRSRHLRQARRRRVQHLFAFGRRDRAGRLRELRHAATIIASSNRWA